MQSAFANNGLGNFGVADADNSIDMQQNISMNIQARCDADANQEIKNESYQIQNLSAKECTIAKNSMTQKFACINNIVAQASESESLQQTAKSTGGFDMSSLLMILIIIGAVLLAPLLLGRLLTGGGKKNSQYDQLMAASSNYGVQADALSAVAMA